MSKKTKNVKNRLVSTIQANYSIDNLQERNPSSSANYKLKTLISQKIQSNNLSKPNSKTKRVYLTNMNRLVQNHNISIQSPQKHECLQSLNSQLKHRYITRVKSSNCGTIRNSVLANEKSIRQTNKLNKIIKNINEVQFESELYWNGNNSYLVTGVKNQYEKIKKAYQDKCIQIQKIKRQYHVDQAKQLKIYIEKIEKENTRLVEACERFRNKLHKQRQAKSHLPELVLQKFKNNQQNQIIQNQLDQIYERYQKLQKKITNLQYKNSTLIKQNKNLITKVFLQQKIIIQTENRQFKLSSLCKKLQKQLIQVKENLKKNQAVCRSLQQNSNKNLLDVKSVIREEFWIQKKSLLEKLRQKDLQIDKMDKEILHMKSLLQSWEHEGQIQQDKGEEQQNQSEKSKFPETCEENNQKSKIEFSNNEKIKLKLKTSKHEQMEENVRVQNLSNGLASQRSLNKISLRSKGSIGKGGQKLIEKAIKRQRITALTHKQDSVRCRPVQMNDIQRILEYLKLKLAFGKVDPTQITSFLDYGHIGNNQQNQKDELGNLESKEIQQETIKQNNQQSLQWQVEYINLKEVYNVFLKAPFSIHEAEALLLSRFIIQDIKEPYIYMNWESQNSRRMVKSIIANLLNFDTLTQQTKQKSEELLKKYQTVLIPALKSVTLKTGIISKEKFIQILNGLGLERTKQMDKYIIGKMCQFSQGLDTLNFSHLYAQQIS